MRGASELRAHIEQCIAETAVGARRPMVSGVELFVGWWILKGKMDSLSIYRDVLYKHGRPREMAIS